MSDLPKPLSNSTGWSTCISFGKYQIFVEEGDSLKIPHFHVVDKLTYGKKFHCRILINKPHYYKGETTKLNKTDIKLICKSLDNQISKENAYTGWQDILVSWYDWNSKISLTKKRPNYEAKLI